MAKEVINFRLDPELIFALRIIAERNNATISELLRWAISKIIEENRNNEGTLWVPPKPKVEYKPRVLSEKQKQEVRIRAQAQTKARAALRKNHREEHLQLVRDHGRDVGRSLLVRMYYEEYRDLYQIARQQLA